CVAKASIATRRTSATSWRRTWPSGSCPSGGRSSPRCPRRAWASSTRRCCARSTPTASSWWWSSDLPLDLRPSMTTILAASVFERLGDDLWLLVPAFAFSLLAAALIGRVLCVRRSFAATLMSGTIGWVVGAVVALWIASDAHPATEGFARNLFLFSLLGTMAAAVWLEFLARPGIVMRAQTGLQSVPHPVRSLRRRGRRVQRYAEITRIAVRNGLGPSLGLGRKEAVEAAGTRPPVRRLRLALEECGGMFVKLGAGMSTGTDLLSAQAAARLRLPSGP